MRNKLDNSIQRFDRVFKGNSFNSLCFPIKEFHTELILYYRKFMPILPEKFRRMMVSVQTIFVTTGICYNFLHNNGDDSGEVIIPSFKEPEDVSKAIFSLCSDGIIPTHTYKLNLEVFQFLMEYENLSWFKRYHRVKKILDDYATDDAITGQIDMLRECNMGFIRCIKSGKLYYLNAENQFNDGFKVEF